MLTGRVIRIGPSKRFLGHPTSEPERLPETPPSTIPTKPRQYSLIDRSPKPKTKGRRDPNPPAVDAGVVAFFDGSFAQGRAAFGAVIYRDGKRIYQAAERVPTAPHLSCNVAEYSGVIHVLRFFCREGIREATIYGDSLLVVKQLNGQWRAREGAYLPYYREAIELRRTLPEIRIAWTSRNYNTEADKLSKQPHWQPKIL